MTRSRLAGSLASGLLMLSLAAEFAPSSAAALPECVLAGTGMSDNRWVGGRFGVWSSPQNWSLGAPPAQSDAPDQYVCIPDDVTIAMDGSGDPRVDVQAIELGRRSSLLMAPGTSLFVWGDPASRPSLTRPGSVIGVRGATLGGTGKINVLGTVRIESDDDSIARMSTDSGLGEVYAGRSGRLVIRKGGLLDVVGTGDVLLSWGYTVDLRGTARLREDAAIVADHGTRFEVAPEGEFSIENDRGYLEGPDRGIDELSVFVNRGLVVKTKGIGTSSITADYGTVTEENDLKQDLKQNVEHVRVETGTLILPESTWALAWAEQGTTYGSGICDGDFRVCNAINSEQFASMQVPEGDEDGAAVVVTPLDKPDPDAGVGRPFRVHADNLQATPEDPAIIELRLDQAILDEFGRPSDPAAMVVRRKVSLRAKPVTLVDCPPTGIVPAEEVACVDRGPEGSRTTPDGDVVMVVRAIETSRWIVD